MSFGISTPCDQPSSAVEPQPTKLWRPQRPFLRRESWNIPAREIPDRAEDVPAFTRELGTPRRVFAKSPLERKPMYLDTQSPVLGRIRCRHARQAATEDPGARMRFSEMLPAPHQCWLRDPDGERYLSESRIVAVEQSPRRGEHTEDLGGRAQVAYA